MDQKEKEMRTTNKIICSYMQTLIRMIEEAPPINIKECKEIHDKMDEIQRYITHVIEPRHQDDIIKAGDLYRKEKAEAKAQKEYEKKITDQAIRNSNGQQPNGFKLTPETREQVQKQKGNSPILSGAEQGWSI